MIGWRRASSSSRRARSPGARQLRPRPWRAGGAALLAELAPGAWPWAWRWPLRFIWSPGWRWTHGSGRTRRPLDQRTPRRRPSMWNLSTRPIGRLWRPFRRRSSRRRQPRQLRRRRPRGLHHHPLRDHRPPARNRTTIRCSGFRSATQLAKPAPSCGPASAALTSTCRSCLGRCLAGARPRPAVVRARPSSRRSGPTRYPPTPSTAGPSRRWAMLAWSGKTASKRPRGA